jgi:transcriptional regulator with XRE-family HTH domain
MGQLGRFIDEYKDRQEYRPSSADIAKRLGVSKSTVGNWYDGSMPSPENLRALSTLIGVSYTRLLDAALVDAAYLPRESDRDDAAPTTPAEWDRRRADLRAGPRPLDEDAIVKLIGPRPGEVQATGSGEVTAQPRRSRRRA